MRKYVFLWSAIIVFVLTLVLAFENIWLVQQYFVLFYTFNASTTIIVLLAGVLGFLVGFFAMLYVFELKKEREMAAENDEMGAPPAQMVEELPPEPAPKKTEDHAAQVDDFDEDDEVLG